MIFRLAENKDIELLSELENKVFHSPWTLEQFKYEVLENQYAKVIVLILDDTLVGYIDYWIIFDQATINKVCVSEKFRKQGIGQKLLDFALKDFKKNECLIATLEVRVSNKAAISLYEKNGFEIVLTKKQYYSDGEDAFYMVKGVN